MGYFFSLRGLYEACSKSLNMICFNSNHFCVPGTSQEKASSHSASPRSLKDKRKSLFFKESPFLVPQAFHSPDLFLHVRQRLPELSLNCFNLAFFCMEFGERREKGFHLSVETPKHLLHTHSYLFLLLLTLHQAPTPPPLPHPPFHSLLSHGLCLNFTGESFDRYCP